VPRDSQQVRIDGLADLRRDLRTIDRNLGRELTRALREAVKPVAREAAAQAPVDTGRLAQSIRPYAAGNRAGIRSRLPYANPIHWGWQERGIEPRPFALEAAESRLDDIADRLGEHIDDLAARNGFR